MMPRPPPCRAQRERVLAVTSAAGAGGGGGDAAGGGSSKTYRGMNAYKDYTAGFRREGHTVGAEKGTGAHGPLRGNVFVRSTARCGGCACGSSQTDP